MNEIPQPKFELAQRVKHGCRLAAMNMTMLVADLQWSVKGNCWLVLVEWMDLSDLRRVIIDETHLVAAEE